MSRSPQSFRRCVAIAGRRCRHRRDILAGARERLDRFGVRLRQREQALPRVPDFFQRGQRQREFFDQQLGGVEFAGRHETARIATVQFVARLSESCERVHQTCRAAARARAAQNGAFDRRDRARMRKGSGTEPQERMLEQRQQRHRFESAQRGFGCEAREGPCRGVGERIAAGIIDHDVPAFERGHHAARERAVGRHQRRGLAGRLDGFAQAIAIASASSSALALSMTVTPAIALSAATVNRAP